MLFMVVGPLNIGEAETAVLPSPSPSGVLIVSLQCARSFDPLAFGDAKLPDGGGGGGAGAPGSFQRRDTGQAEQEQQHLIGCTPMQEFLSVALDSTKKTYVSTYATTAYQVLKAMCR